MTSTTKYFESKQQNGCSAWVLTKDGVNVLKNNSKPFDKSTSSLDNQSSSDIAPLIGRLSAAERAWSTKGKLFRAIHDRKDDPRKEESLKGNLSTEAMRKQHPKEIALREKYLKTDEPVKQKVESTSAHDVSKSRIPKFVMPDESHAFEVVYPNAIRTQRSRIDNPDKIEDDLYSRKAIRRRERMRLGLDPDVVDTSEDIEKLKPKSIFQAEIDSIFKDDSDIDGSDDGDDPNSFENQVKRVSSQAEDNSAGWFGNESSRHDASRHSSNSFYSPFQQHKIKRPETVKVLKRQCDESAVSAQFYRPVVRANCRPSTASIPSRDYSKKASNNLVVCGNTNSLQYSDFSQQLTKSETAGPQRLKPRPLTAHVSSNARQTHPKVGPGVPSVDGDSAVARRMYHKARPSSAIAQTRALAKALHEMKLEIRDIRYSTALASRAQKQRVDSLKSSSSGSINSHSSSSQREFEDYAIAIDPERLPQSLRARILWPFAVDSGHGAMPSDLQSNPVNPMGISSAALLSSDQMLRSKYGPQRGQGSYEDDILSPNNLSRQLVPLETGNEMIEGYTDHLIECQDESCRQIDASTCVDTEGYVTLETAAHDDDGILLVHSIRVPYDVLMGDKESGFTDDGDEVTHLALRSQLQNGTWKVLQLPTTQMESRKTDFGHCLDKVPESLLDASQLPAGAVSERMRLERDGNFEQAADDAKSLGIAQAETLSYLRKEKNGRNEDYYAELISSKVLEFDEHEKVDDSVRSERRAQKMCALNLHNPTLGDGQLIQTCDEKTETASRTCYGCWREAHGQSAQIDVVTEDDKTLFRHYCDRHRAEMHKREVSRCLVLDRRIPRQQEETAFLQLQRHVLLNDDPHSIKPLIARPGSEKTSALVHDSCSTPKVISTGISGAVASKDKVVIQVIGGESRVSSGLFTDMTWRTYCDDSVQRAISTAVVAPHTPNGGEMNPLSKSLAFSNKTNSKRESHSDHQASMDKILEHRRTASTLRSKARKDAEEAINQLKLAQSGDNTVFNRDINSSRKVSCMRPQTASVSRNNNNALQSQSLWRPSTAIPINLNEPALNEETAHVSEGDEEAQVKSEADQTFESAETSDKASYDLIKLSKQYVRPHTAGPFKARENPIHIASKITTPNGFKGSIYRGTLQTNQHGILSIAPHSQQLVTAIRRKPLGPGSGRIAIELLTPQMLEEEKLRTAALARFEFEASTQSTSGVNQRKSEVPPIEGIPSINSNEDSKKLENTDIPFVDTTLGTSELDSQTTMRSLRSANHVSEDHLMPKNLISEEHRIKDTFDTNVAKAPLERKGTMIDLSARLADSLAGAPTPLSPTAAIPSASAISAAKDVWIPKTVLKSRPSTAKERRTSEGGHPFHHERISIRHMKYTNGHFAPYARNCEASFEPRSQQSLIQTPSARFKEVEIIAGESDECISDMTAVSDLRNTTNEMIRSIPQLLDHQ